MSNHIPIPDNDDVLLDQCEIDVFRSSGPGGQHVNTTESAVRLRHRPSGIMVTCQDTRSQHENKRICLEKLRERLRQRNRRRRPRKRTRVPKGSREKRLQGKRHRSRKKELRKPPKRDDH